MIRGSVEMTKDNVPQFLESIKRFSDYELLVGIPENKTDRRDDVKITNASLGYIHEFGSPARNIPARPHLIVGIKKKAKHISALLEKGAKAAIEGHPEALRQSLNAAGIIAVSSVKNQITNGTFVPLAPSTIANRKRKHKTHDEEGFEGFKPLIDTGQYRNSITYVVRRKTRKNRQMVMPQTVKQKIDKEWRLTPDVE